MTEHADLFGRAALVARDPTRYRQVDGLSAEELAALEYEEGHKWHGPTMLWYSIALCAIGAGKSGRWKSSRVRKTNIFDSNTRMGSDR